MKDYILQEDLESIAKSGLPFEEMYGKTVLVTGATGLVGSQTMKALLTMNDICGADIHIIGIVRNRDKAERIFREMETDNLEYVTQDITEKIAVSGNVDYIIHAASPTSSKFFVDCPVETILAAVNGTNRILELAKEKEVRGMVYLSSMEAFGITDSRLECVREENLGYIDILNVRSSYSEGKRICECLCASYAKEYGVNVKIARLAQTFGAGILPEENRVFAQFARSAMKGEDIVLHTEGKSVGNYCYTRDVIKGILLLLIRGKKGEAYTVANGNSSMAIRDMAKLVAEKIADKPIKVVFDIPADAHVYGYAPDVKMKLNSDKLQALGWKPEVSLEDSYRRMIKSMEMQNKEPNRGDVK